MTRPLTTEPLEMPTTMCPPELSAWVDTDRNRSTVSREMDDSVMLIAFSSSMGITCGACVRTGHTVLGRGGAHGVGAQGGEGERGEVTACLVLTCRVCEWS